MKVSIVIPVYNAEKYLKECIESALTQTYKNIEIIAIDDGSTDHSLEILKEYASQIKIISKQNGGTPTALNAGIRMMAGEWFKWLSADDVLYENAVEILMDDVKKLGSQAYDCIFYTHYNIIDSSGTNIGTFTEPNYNQFSNFAKNVMLLDRFIGNGTTSLIHKSIFDRFGLFDETVGFQEDYEFWLRCCLLHNCTFHLIPKIVAKYRVHEKQLTQTKNNVALKHSETIRNLILNKMTSELRQKYLNELQNWRKNRYPLNVRIRRQIRDYIFRFLPTSISEKILKIYLEYKKL